LVKVDAVGGRNLRHRLFTTARNPPSDANRGDLMNAENKRGSARSKFEINALRGTEGN
jgi:hypothetical protein